jgi:hypothetical protein
MAGTGRGAVKRRDRGRLGRGDDAEAGFDQIFGEGRGMVGASPRAGQHHARRIGLQAPRQQCDRSRIGEQLRGDHRPGLARFGEHIRAFGRDHASAFSSATKS